VVGGAALAVTVGVVVKVTTASGGVEAPPPQPLSKVVAAASQSPAIARGVQAHLVVREAVAMIDMSQALSHPARLKAQRKSPSPPRAVSAAAAEAELKPCRYAMGLIRASSREGIWPLTPSCRKAVR